MDLPDLRFYASDDVVSVYTESEYDGLILFFSDKQDLVSKIPSVSKHFALDATFGDSIQLVIPDDGLPAERVLIVPTGSLDNDFDDARRFRDAAFEAGVKALKIGMTRCLVSFCTEPTTGSLSWSFSETQTDYQHFLPVTVLGLLEASFEPVDVRQHYELTQKKVPTLAHLGFMTTSVPEENFGELMQSIRAIEAGRRVARDIGNPDPEIMAPKNIVKYILQQFESIDNVKVTVIDELDVIKKEYPLAHAVTRASLAVERHHPRFVLFEYKSPEQEKVEENLYFVGKGVTYDTGGADIKCSGHMRDMSRDKCGAAAVTGFFKTVSMLSPERVNVTGGIALVRNSVGPDMYVSDEVIVARSGMRVMVGNTDAEGRMVMTDLLCQFKEQILAKKAANEPASDKPSFLFTCATLTGHAIRAYDGYGITLDNGFARKNKISRRIYDAGHVLADPFEISTLRREDLEVVKPGRSSEDIVSANDRPSTMTNRGHQYPAGFMLQASGLDKYGLNNKEHIHIGYTHLDIAGAAEVSSAVGWSLPRVTGAPVAALTGAFLL
ncbi:hypothetical protein BDB01DRAFT_839886 [Pilobolus umbonatus]|nr:hypothetical protein BDB01DRAFT_839886 [Pilobolus umbonatus]